MNVATPSVLVIEDEVSIAEAVVFHLSRAGMNATSAGDGLTGLRLLRTQLPDVLVLDLMLPHIDGWHIIREVREWAPSLPIIVVTARTNEHDRVEVLRLGADDVMSKPFSMRELTARVGAALRRATVAPQAEHEPIREGDLVIDLERLTAHLDGEPVALTPLEFRLLCVLAAESGRTIDRDTLYTRVWGGERAHGDRSVDVLVRRLRRKVDEVPGRHTYVQTQHGVGYRFRATPRAMPGSARWQAHPAP